MQISTTTNTQTGTISGCSWVKKIAICSSTATVVPLTLFRSDKEVKVRNQIQFAFFIVSRCVGGRFKISKQYKIKIIPQPWYLALHHCFCKILRKQHTVWTITVQITENSFNLQNFRLIQPIITVAFINIPDLLSEPIHIFYWHYKKNQYFFLYIVQI